MGLCLYILSFPLFLEQELIVSMLKIDTLNLDVFCLGLKMMLEMNSEKMFATATAFFFLYLDFRHEQDLFQNKTIFTMKKNFNRQMLSLTFNQTVKG